MAALSSSKRSKTILVVGDVNLDVTWLVVPPPPSSTSQAHGGVVPEKLVDAGLQMEMVGSAGTIGRAICMADANVKVKVVGGWAEARPTDLIPELSPPKGWTRGFIRKGQIKFLRAVKPPFTRVITRVYAPGKAGKERYLKRYDRELVDTEDKPDRKFKWPDPKTIDLVLVGDYNKGFLLQERVVEALKKYREKPFILRAKRKLDHRVIKELPWTLLCPNREDFKELLSQERPIQTALRKVGDQWSCDPDILKGLQELRKQFPGRTILLKLDREGALLFHEANLTIFPLARASQGEWAGIGAGDTLMATLAVQLVRQPAMALKQAVKESVKAATAYCRVASDLRRWPGWYGTTAGVENLAVDKTQFDTEPPTHSLAQSLGDWEVASSYSKLVDGKKMVIADAECYLQGFLTVDPKLGSDLRRLRYQIQDYLSREGHTRPFATAICGAPGSGKSSLVKALADELGCARILENAAQWTDIAQLFRACEEVRTRHLERKHALVLIDEVDSEVAREHLYAKLLAPLWDGFYQLGGEVRTLGLPLVFLLAGSSPRWKTAESLLCKQHNEPKLWDLVSRFSTYPLEIPSLKDRPLDAVYLAARFFKKKFPLVRRVEKEVLKLFGESTFEHETRSIEQVIELLGPLQKDEEVSAKDLNWELDELKQHLSLEKKWTGWLKKRKTQKAMLPRDDFIELA